MSPGVVAWPRAFGCDLVPRRRAGRQRTRHKVALSWRLWACRLTHAAAGERKSLRGAAGRHERLTVLTCVIAGPAAAMSGPGKCVF